MINLETHVIYDPIDSIIEKLRLDLLKRNSHLLRKTKTSGNNIMITCPYHNNGLERNPSCGIRNDGLFHCFSCGKKGFITDFISHCLGHFVDGGYYGKRWLIDNFVSHGVENRRQIEMTKRQNIEQVFVKEEELDKYRYVHDYMYTRKLTDEIIEKFDVGYDKDFTLDNVKKIPCLTFPVRDIKGRTLFIARRSVNFKLFHYPEHIEKPVYGIYEIMQQPQTNKIFICESIINALTIWCHGGYAVALLGTGNSKQYEDLKKLPCRQIVLALDNDEAGRIGTEKLKKILENKFLTSILQLPYGRDVNDLSKDEFLQLEEIM